MLPIIPTAELSTPTDEPVGHGRRVGLDGEKAAVACRAGNVGHRLTAEHADAAEREWLADSDAGVVDKIFGLKIVAAFNNEVVVLENLRAVSGVRNS